MPALSSTAVRLRSTGCWRTPSGQSAASPPWVTCRRSPPARWESRHLGLVTAQEVDGLRQKLQDLAAAVEQSVDLDAVLSLARTAPPLHSPEPPDAPALSGTHPVLAVARDRAFCFYYRENLRLLEHLGARLRFFSPLEEDVLPPCDGLYLGGGYPELYAGRLSANRSMRESIRTAVGEGLPTFAECGGFLYLHQTLTDEDGPHPMAGVFPGGCRSTGRLRPVRLRHADCPDGQSALPGRRADPRP